MSVSDRRSGIHRISDERARHLSIGWSASHDEGHDEAQLAIAAACYAAPVRIYTRGRRRGFRDAWPWEEEADKRPYDVDGKPRAPTARERVRLLEKAGALIAAEIDRLIREEES